MKKVIEKRELVVLNRFGDIVRGTFHKTRDDNSAEQSSLNRESRIGILFLNSLSPTRAGKGDSSVYWADSFAEAGYPSFRIDLSGFGDSAGDPPDELLSFINRGGYAKEVSAKAKEIRERFDLSGVVLVGLCAGAVSAMYAAVTVAECRGLILLDPYFSLPLVTRSRTWERLSDRLQQGSVRRLIKIASNRVKAVRAVFRRDVLPSNSNLPLLSCLKQVASAKLPIIIFKVASPARDHEFDYISYALGQAGQVNEVMIKTIEGADHTFANRVGRRAVLDEAKKWLSRWFPLVRQQSSCSRMSERGCTLTKISDEDYENSEPIGHALEGRG